MTSLHEAVEKLYYLRDHFYDTENEFQEEKWDFIRREMKNTVALLRKSKDTDEQTSDTNQAVFHYLIGKTYNVMPEQDSEALSYLSSAVKLNPSYVEAWNELGECYWKGGDIMSAKNCFSRALEKSRNKVSLRNLSVVLRQLKTDSEERKKLLFEGLDLAKEAVQLDPSDGNSWLILGNSYFSVVFHSVQSDGYIYKALAAYGQAEKYDVNQRNFNTADLCFNKAMALLYDEKYQDALKNLECCQKYDPSWGLPKSKYDATLSFLIGVREMVVTKGKLKPRKLKNLLKGIQSKDFGSFKPVSSLKRTLLQDLTPGSNEGKYIVVKVISSVLFDGGSPLVCCITDTENYAAITTIYRLSQEYGLSFGDTILIPEPKMHTTHISVKSEIVEYQCVRVDAPQTILVNGRSLNPNQMASIFIKFSSS